MATKGKEFEEAVACILSEIEGVEVESPQGSCKSCRMSSCSCNIRYCPDVVTTVGKRKFVINSKNCGADSYITRKDVDKLIRDKEKERANRGFIVTTCGQISLELLQYLRENDCRFLYVGDFDSMSNEDLKKLLYLLTLI